MEEYGIRAERERLNNIIEDYMCENARLRKERDEEIEIIEKMYENKYEPDKMYIIYHNYRRKQ